MSPIIDSAIGLQNNSNVNIERWVQNDLGGDFIKIKNNYNGTHPVKLAAIQHLWEENKFWDDYYWSYNILGLIILISMFYLGKNEELIDEKTGYTNEFKED